MSEYQIRAALRGCLETAHFGENALILDELGIGDARADLAVVNGAIHGYEIKSSADTLARLARQQEAYSNLFDTVTIVATRKHLPNIQSAIPGWWGIVEATASGDAVELLERRNPQQNPSVCILSVAKLLWRSEAISILESIGKARGLRSATRFTICEAIVAALCEADVKKLVRDCLKERKNWRVGAQQKSGGGSSRPVSMSLHSPVRQCHLHNHQYTRPPS